MERFLPTVKHILVRLGYSVLFLALMVPAEAEADSPEISAQPSSLMIGAGSNAVFIVTATGTSLSYQWRNGASDLVNGGNVAGATSASLTLSSVSQSDASTNYTVNISNTSSNVTSDVVSLTVIDPPTILVNPLSLTNLAGTVASFSVTATGTQPLTYQWQFEGMDLPGETTDSLVVFNLEPAAAGNYTVVITNFAGAVTSSPAVLSVHCLLTAEAAFGGNVAKDPDQSSYTSGSTVNLTATPDVGFVFTGWSGDASGTNNPLSVTMDTNKYITANFMGPGAAIIIDNNDPRAEFEGFWFTLAYINPHYGVDYRYASPGTNLVTSRATYRPEIVRPGHYDVYLFYPQRPIVRTTNAQWVVAYDGGNVSLGLDQHTNGGKWFQIAADKPFVMGTNQFVRVSNDTGETETNAYVMADAVRFVYSAVQGIAPTFVTEPVSQTVNQTSNVTFTVQATGTGTLVYQWRFNNEPISGATGTSYTRTNVQPSHAGNYAVVVIHDDGSAISSNAMLTVNSPPTITTQPTNKTITAGKSHTFTVVATGTAPLSYQWQFESVAISGATDSIYSFSLITTNKAGNYSVVISNVAAAVTSSNAVLTVTDDSGIPGVSFVSPAVGGKVTNALITMTGTAKDNIGIAEVKYVFEGVTNTATGTTNWLANLNLTPGTNSVVAWSIDFSGNESLRKTNLFYYYSTNFLVLNIVGSGQVSGVTNGQGLLVGCSYVASVLAGNNFIFTNWTGTVTSTNTAFSFVMQSNMVLNANFITNPFIATAGSYNGLFFEAGGVAHHSAGFFQIKLSSKAIYSGKLLLDGNTIILSGKFDLSGKTSRVLSRSKLGKSALNLSLELDWSTTNETIHGVLTDGVWTSDMLGDRAVYDAISNPETNFVGRYTMLIPPLSGQNFSSGGYGYGLVTNSSAGIIKVSKGALGDGAILSQTVSMSKAGHWPLYIPAYKSITYYTNGPTVTTNKTELRGSLLGWVNFTNNPTRTLVGTVSWIKTKLSPTNIYYPAGFTNEMDLIASAYTPPSSGTRLLAITDGTVVLQEGNLVLSLTNSITLRSNNLATVATTNNLLKVSFDTKTGLLKGTFAHPNNTNKITSFSGAVLQQQNYGAGYFLGVDESGVIILDGN